VLDEMLGQLYIVKTALVVDRGKLRATLYKSGKKIWSARVGIGKSGTPTPRGQFWIRERLKGIGGNSVYGPWAFGTSAYSNLSDWPGGGVVGIHGTNQPGLIPGRPSHGCIRVRNDKIRLLAKLMPIGTPLSIIN
jgi:lipoprotein-anchoring transpeptidase ErfK/SrfK